VLSSAHGDDIKGQPIDVQIRPEFQESLSAVWICKVAKLALLKGLASSGITDIGHRLSLLVTGDDVVRNLNRKYRGLDKTTDVLAFSSEHPGIYMGNEEPITSVLSSPFITPKEYSHFVGEVIISYPQCERQATSEGKTAKDEMALLIAHGVLHLIGFDHLDLGEELAMKGVETEILSGIEDSEAQI
jgi:probable rRNA maturation factor